MTQKGSPGGRAGAAAAAPSAEGAAPTTGQLQYTPKPARLSSPVANLQALALDAQRRAEGARTLAECCQAAGDVAGWRYWRRLMLAHQAILWAATHPQEVTTP